METSKGRHIWAERFDRQLDDLFTIQDEITEEIVAAMDVKLLQVNGLVGLGRPFEVLLLASVSIVVGNRCLFPKRRT